MSFHVSLAPLPQKGGGANLVLVAGGGEGRGELLQPPVVGWSRQYREGPVSPTRVATNINYLNNVNRYVSYPCFPESGGESPPALGGHWGVLTPQVRGALGGEPPQHRNMDEGGSGRCPPPETTRGAGGVAPQLTAYD